MHDPSKQSQVGLAVGIARKDSQTAPQHRDKQDRASFLHALLPRPISRPSTASESSADAGAAEATRSLDASSGLGITLESVF